MKKRHIRIPTLIETIINSKPSPTTFSGAQNNSPIAIKMQSCNAASSLLSSSSSQSTHPSSEDILNQDIFCWEKIFEDLQKSSSQFLLPTILMNFETSLICGKNTRHNGEVIAWKEMISNILAITIRILLDDQKVNHFN